MINEFKKAYFIINKIIAIIKDSRTNVNDIYVLCIKVYTFISSYIKFKITANWQILKSSQPFNLQDNLNEIDIFKISIRRFKRLSKLKIMDVKLKT